MAAKEARTQRCVQVRQRGIADQFGGSQFTVDLRDHTATYDVANLSVVFGYAELLAFKNQVDTAVELLAPPTPVGRIYAPKLGNH